MQHDGFRGILRQRPQQDLHYPSSGRLGRTSSTAYTAKLPETLGSSSPRAPPYPKTVHLSIIANTSEYSSLLVSNLTLPYRPV